MLQLRRLVTLAGVFTALAGPLAAQVAVADLYVSPENLTLRVGEKKVVTAQAFDRSNNVISTARFTYRSANPAVAVVDAEGQVTGRSAGATVVEARAGTHTASVNVTVTGAAAAGAAGTSSLAAVPVGTSRIQIDPATLYLLPFESQRLVARAISADGTVLGPVQATWRSLTPGAISVDSITGNVVGLAAGSGVIEARSANGLSATAPGQVTAVPFAAERPVIGLSPDEFDTLRVVVPAQNGRRLEAGLTFVSTNPSIVQVGTTGILQAKGPGQTEVVVTGYFQEVRVTVKVHRPIAMFKLLPAPVDGPVTVPILGFREVSGVAEAADSTAIPEAPLRWEVADTTIAAYDTATHHINGRKQGTTRLQLTARGYEPKVWTINVVPGLVALSKSELGIRMGDTTTVAAHLKDENGTDFGPAPDLVWTSVKPEVVRVSSDGKLTAAAPGRSLVIATAAWGRSDSVDVIVTGDLLLTSDRRQVGRPGIFQYSLSRPDSLFLIAADTRTYAAPVLSPDRRHIVYSLTTNGTNYDLWLADADGGNAHQLTTDSLPETAPAWTPDGQKIVYTITARREGAQLAIIGIDGHGKQMLTTLPLNASAPAVSPDGRRVAFIGVKDRKPDVYLMDLGGTAATAVARNITVHPDNELQVEWLPNGDLAALVEGDHDRGFQVIRLAVAAGTNARTVLATSAYPVSGFSVSRDGSMLAYVATEPLANNRNQRTKTVLYLLPLTPGSTATAVRTPVTETLGAPAF